MARLLKSLIFASALTLSTAGHGAIITYDFSGTLTSSFGTLNSGDAFSGSYTLDTAVPATGLSDVSYAVFNNLLSVTLTIGAFTAFVGPGVELPEIQQDDVSGADRYALVGRNALGSAQMDGLDLAVIAFRLDDPSGTAVSDATELLTNPALANFSGNEFFLFFAGPDIEEGQRIEFVSGRLTSLRTVPEPATLALLGIGLVGIGISFPRRGQTACAQI